MEFRYRAGERHSPSDDPFVEEPPLPDVGYVGVGGCGGGFEVAPTIREREALLRDLQIGWILEEILAREAAEQRRALEGEVWVELGIARATAASRIGVERRAVRPEEMVLGVERGLLLDGGNSRLEPVILDRHLERELRRNTDSRIGSRLTERYSSSLGVDRGMLLDPEARLRATMVDRYRSLTGSLAHRDVLGLEPRMLLQPEARIHERLPLADAPLHTQLDIQQELGYQGTLTARFLSPAWVPLPLEVDLEQETQLQLPGSSNDP